MLNAIVESNAQIVADQLTGLENNRENKRDGCD
jgi:hypothetical protein